MSVAPCSTCRIVHEGTTELCPYCGAFGETLTVGLPGYEPGMLYHGAAKGRVWHLEQVAKAAETYLYNGERWDLIATTEALDAWEKAP